MAATDIAHIVTAAIHADLLRDGGEEELLRYYYGELRRHLVEYGAFQSEEGVEQSYGFNVFMNQYETGVLDMCRLVIAYAWSRCEFVNEDDDEGVARTVNKNSYNKSRSNVVWLMSRCHEILQSRGV